MPNQDPLPIEIVPPKGKHSQGRWTLRWLLPVASLASAAFVAPFAWEASDLKPNIVFACVLWLIVWACLHRTLIELPILKRRGLFLKAVLAVGIPATALIVFWTPIREKHKEQNGPDKEQSLQNFIKGADYPTIGVELYWGPTNGMPHTVTLAEKSAPLCVINYQNTNAFPIYDLSLSLFRASAPNLFADFNKGEKDLAILKNDGVHTVFCQIPPEDRVSMSFAVSTRAGFTIHNFNYALIGDSWEHSNNVVGPDQKKRTEVVSNGFKTK